MNVKLSINLQVKYRLQRLFINKENILKLYIPTVQRQLNSGCKQMTSSPKQYGGRQDLFMDLLRFCLICTTTDPKLYLANIYAAKLLYILKQRTFCSISLLNLTTQPSFK